MRDAEADPKIYVLKQKLNRLLCLRDRLSVILVQSCAEAEPQQPGLPTPGLPTEAELHMQEGYERRVLNS